MIKLKEKLKKGIKMKEIVNISCLTDDIAVLAENKKRCRRAASRNGSDTAKYIQHEIKQEENKSNISFPVRIVSLSS